MPAKKPAKATATKPKKAAPKAATAAKPKAPAVKAVPTKAVPAKAAPSKPAVPAKAAAPDKAAAAPSKSAPAKGNGAKAAARAEPPMATFVRRNPLPIPAAPVDGEDGEDSGLLTGPRNVQPYVVKRGEQYMSKQQLEHFRLILNTWKRDLMEEVDRTVSHMKDEAANFPDPNDRATQEEEFSLELRTRDRERKLIRKIDEAIKRIEDGSYGYCLETGEEIGIKRLEARPVATLSIEAQERRERREKQYGERDDRYR
ncbi:MAG: RNA polymerase-binding protein DksA [Gammaproteobacteria bacterium]|nr:RNA polymerase-binding protein DksA [Gammaproteobacteria bacterium]